MPNDTVAEVISPTLRDFNPTNSPIVDEIKARTDDLIAYIEDSIPSGRRCALAVTNYEQGAMWAVKALFAS